MTSAARSARTTMAAALASERPLVMPLAHDALTVRLIARAGFRAFAIGGSAMLAARYALPDLGLVGLAGAGWVGHWTHRLDVHLAPALPRHDVVVRQ